ncbi:unnamed protein product, partial [marine sediment metagenome]
YEQPMALGESDGLMTGYGKKITIFLLSRD